MYDEKDGMRYPSVSDLVSVTHSKYKLVIGAAIRAREIDEGQEILIDDPHNKKSIGIALEEILDKKVVIVEKKPVVIQETEE